VYTVFALHSPSYTLSHLLPAPTGTKPPPTPGNLLHSCSPILLKKKKRYLSFKLAKQEFPSHMKKFNILLSLKIQKSDIEGMYLKK
jgi:hypothetical protein